MDEEGGIEGVERRARGAEPPADPRGVVSFVPPPAASERVSPAANGDDASPRLASASVPSAEALDDDGVIGLSRSSSGEGWSTWREDEPGFSKLSGPRVGSYRRASSSSSSSFSSVDFDLPPPSSQEGKASNILSEFQDYLEVIESQSPIDCMDIDLPPSSSEDIETLAAKACALASTPVPDYAGTFARKDQKYKTKKYRDKDVQRASREDDDPNSIRLAGRTSNILSAFQDYLEVIESQSPSDSILEYKPAKVATKTGEERSGVVLTEWNWGDEVSNQPERRSSRDRNSYYPEDKMANTLSHSNDASADFPGNEEKRHSYLNSALHSKRFRIGALSTIVALVLLGVMIGITSSDGAKEDFEREYLERVQGLELGSAGEHSDTAALRPGVGLPTGEDEADEEIPIASEVATEDTSLVASENTGSPGTLEDESTSMTSANHPSIIFGTGLVASLEEDPTSVTSVDHPSIIEKYAPKLYRRSDGTDDEWLGSSYTDAIAHCAHRDSTIPCPYEAYCPDGPGSTSLLGSRVSRHAQEVWAPIMDIPNGWVNVGQSSDSCKLYSSLHNHPPLWGLGIHHSNEVGSQLREGDAKNVTSHIMCCREPTEGLGLVSQTSAPPERDPVANTKYEQDILDKKHPVWFSREHGYRGTTHEEAVDFCANVAGMVLCPAETYCPQGKTNPDHPLFLQNHAFGGEQWAPVATTSTTLNEKWLLIGKIHENSRSTCSTFGSVRGMKPDGWNLDNVDPEMKQHVMCCLNPNHLVKEIKYAEDLNPIWLDESVGWKGGSHDDAVGFCRKLGANKKLCPYAAYCPHGPGQPVIGGHSKDFNIEGEQWAPVHRDSNYWVMIGQKYGNSATTCMDNWALEGSEPSWGTSNERADLKKHIMCCDF